MLLVFSQRFESGVALRLPPQSTTLFLLAFLCTLFLALCSSSASLSPLADAAQKSDRPTIQALLKQHTDPNAPQVDGTTALLWAAYLDDLETSRLLLKAGANASTTNLSGVAAMAPWSKRSSTAEPIPIRACPETKPPS